MRRLAALVALLLACSALAAEVPVSDVILGDPNAYSGPPAIATDGDGFLVVWSDGRSVDSILFAARVTRSGQVLDPTGIPLHRAGVGRPQVIWNGERYLVFWSEGYPGRIMLAEVNRDGSVRPPRTLIDNAVFDEYRGTPVATNGSRILMVYGDKQGTFGWPSRIRVGVRNLDATPVAESVVDAADPEDMYHLMDPRPTIVVNASQFLVSWDVPAAEEGERRAVRFSPNGARIDATPRRIGSGATAIAVNGSGYVVLSAYTSWGVSGDLQTITDPVELPLAINSYPVLIERNGRASLLGLDLRQGTEGGIPSVLQFDDQGHAGASQAAPPSAGSVAGLSNGHDVLFVTSIRDATFEDPPRLFAVVTNAVTLQAQSPTVPLTSSAPRQEAPSIATNGIDTLTAWREPDGIFAGRVRGNGTRIDGRGVRLSDGIGDGYPRVAFDGERYVIAFTHWKGPQDTEVVVRFISPQSGLLPDEIRVQGANAGLEVALARGGDSVLLVWPDGQKLYAARIRAMQLIDTPLPMTISGFAALSPAAAWNGNEFLIAWREVVFGFDSESYPRIRGARLSANLTPVDTQSRVLLEETGELSFHWEPSLVWDGTQWVLAATVTRFGRETPEVRVVRIDGNLNPISTTAIGKGSAPQLAVADTRVWLAWKEDTAERSLRLGVLDSNEQHVIPAPTPTVYQWPNQFGMTAKGTQVILAYPRIAGVESGTVPRVFLTTAGQAAGPARRRSVR